MPDFLKKNYGRTLWITRVVLGLSVLLGQMFFIDSVFSLTAYMGVRIPRAWYVYLLYGFVMVVVTELAIRLLSRLAFNLLHLYVIPLNEFAILMMWASAAINVLCGLVKLLYLITPAISVFGELLIGFVISAAVYFCLFLAVKKMYLNDKNAPFVFKSAAWIFFALSFLGAFVL